MPEFRGRKSANSFHKNAPAILAPDEQWVNLANDFSELPFRSSVGGIINLYGQSAIHNARRRGEGFTVDNLVGDLAETSFQFYLTQVAGMIVDKEIFKPHLPKSWQMHYDNGTGSALIRHKKNGYTLHEFDNLLADPDNTTTGPLAVEIKAGNMLGDALEVMKGRYINSAASILRDFGAFTYIIIASQSIIEQINNLEENDGQLKLVETFEDNGGIITAFPFTGQELVTLTHTTIARLYPNLRL